MEYENGEIIRITIGDLMRITADSREAQRLRTIYELDMQIRRNNELKEARKAKRRERLKAKKSKEGAK